MSYAPVFVPEARAAWAQLDVWLQELVLDEVERVAADPHRMRQLSNLPGFTREVVEQQAGTTHYVFLVVDVDHVARQLIIQQVGHVQRPTP